MLDGLALTPDFSTLAVTLPNPFPFSISLLSYWDGQPVQYVCCRRPPAGQSPVSSKGMYWSIGFEIVDEDAKAALVKRGKEVLELPVKDSAVGKQKVAGGGVEGTTAASTIPADTRADDSKDID